MKEFYRVIKFLRATNKAKIGEIIKSKPLQVAKLTKMAEIAKLHYTLEKKSYNLFRSVTEQKRVNIDEWIPKCSVFCIFQSRGKLK